MDKDLESIQEVRTLLKQAHDAQKILAKFNQKQIDDIVKVIAEAGYNNAEMLAKMACDETGFGKWEDKVIKNTFGSMSVYNAVRDIKTVGIIAEDREHKTIDIGTGVGVIAGIVPSTNPTSTVMYKAIIAIKGGNSIVFSPHPGAKKCILETVKIISSAAEKAGCPKGAISALTIPTMPAINELMKHELTSLILATGGATMVKSAYSSGTPAIGVGAGNGPAFIDKSADVHMAVKRIIDSKTFDNGTICASEQSVVVEKCMESKVLDELKKQGAYILSGEETERLGKFILRANGTMNPAIVGKSAYRIAQLANISSVPKNTSVLIAHESRVGLDAPYSHEKLAPILAFYVENDVDSVLKRCAEILEFEGAGHTFAIHANDEELVKKFALGVPVSRIMVNTPSALGGVGATTNLFPALTLGCGAVGGSSSSNNIGPLDVINIKRVAYGVKELDDLRRNSSVVGTQKIDGLDENTVEEIVKKILEKLM